MVVAVAESRAEKSTSELRPICTWPWIGSTQAKDCGLPEYSISS